jgi:hypothetical protein
VDLGLVDEGALVDTVGIRAGIREKGKASHGGHGGHRGGLGKPRFGRSLTLPAPGLLKRFHHYLT